MRPAVLSCVFLLAIVSSGLAQAPGGDKVFSPEKSPVARALADAPLQTVASLRGIDPDVLAAFRTVGPTKIVDCGKPYNGSDDVRDPNLPFTRLMLAGKAPSIWFILYEQGGRYYRQHLVVLTQTGPDSWQVGANTAGNVQDTTVEGVKAAVWAGRFKP